jgi:hypothetical protein
MKTLIRLASVGGAVFVAMALAAPALAAYVPKIDATVPNSLGASGHTIIHVAVGAADDSTARVVVYAPLGFTVAPGSPGQTIGSVDAKVRAIDLGGGIVPVTGSIETRAATGTALVNGIPVPLSQLAAQCTGLGVHTAFWVFKLSAGGSTIEFPAFWDTTTGAETAVGSGKVTFCGQPDDVPIGTPNRAPLGIKLVDAVLNFNKVFKNPTSAGVYSWTSIWTPYFPGTGAFNAAGTVTALGLNGLPVTSTLKGRYDKKKRIARLAGKVSAAGRFQAGVKLPLYAGKNKAKMKRTALTSPTTAAGAYTATKRIAGATFFQMRFAAPEVDYTSQGCAALPATLPKCASATVGAFTAWSPIVKVTPRR